MAVAISWKGGGNTMTDHIKEVGYTEQFVRQLHKTAREHDIDLFKAAHLNLIMSLNVIRKPLEETVSDADEITIKEASIMNDIGELDERVDNLGYHIEDLNDEDFLE